MMAVSLLLLLSHASAVAHGAPLLGRLELAATAADGSLLLNENRTVVYIDVGASNYGAFVDYAVQSWGE